MGEVIKLSRLLANKNEVNEIPQPTFRRGTVTAVTSGGQATINIGDDETPVVVPAKRVNAEYIPQVGDKVDIKVVDQEVSLLGTTGQVPTAFRSVSFATGSVSASEAPGSLTYVDLATPGPTIAVTVGPSGVLIVGLTGTFSVTSDNDGACMSFALSGANTLAANDTNCIAFEPMVLNALARFGRTVMLTGLNPGSTTIVAKYRDIADTGTDAFVAARNLWAVSW